MIKLHLQLEYFYAICFLLEFVSDLHRQSHFLFFRIRIQPSKQRCQSFLQKQ